MIAKMDEWVNMKFTKVNMLIFLSAILLVFPFAIEIVISSAYRPIPVWVCWSIAAVFLAIAAYLRGEFKKRPKTIDNRRLANGLIGGGGVITLIALLDAFYYPAHWDLIYLAFHEAIGILPVIAGVVIHLRSRRK